MGARKRKSAEKLKEQRKNTSYAVLRNCPTSPRKMRLMADVIRGKEVNQALDILRYSSKEASQRLEKLLMSAIANWQAKHEGVRMEDANLYVKSVMVDSARMLKRIQPAPQGRAYRIRKRSNHVTLVVDSLNEIEPQVETTEVEQETEN